MFLLFAFLTPIHSLFCVLRYLSLLSLKLPLGKDCFWSISLSLFSELVLALIREPISTSSRSSANDFTSLCLGFLNYKSQNNTSSFPRELWWELNAILLKMLQAGPWKARSILVPEPQWLYSTSKNGYSEFVVWGFEFCKDIFPLGCSEMNEARSTLPPGISLSGGPGTDSRMAQWLGRGSWAKQQ